MQNVLQISDNVSVKHVQDEFTSIFPWLRLEFFRKPHGVGEASPKRELINPSEKLGQWRTKHTSGNVTIVPVQTVGQLEQSFQDNYGLSVQVFRKSGDVWLETSTTDSWTLEKQNEQGRSMSMKEE